MNDSLLQGFAELAQKYEKLAADIASTTPPEEAEEIHAALAKAYTHYADAVRAISKTPKDSYFSPGAMTDFSNAALELGQAFVSVSDLFYRKGVRFGPTEPGNVFMFPR